MMNRLKPLFRLGVSALAFLLAGSCTTLNPATGERDFTPFLSPAQEIELGRKEHPNVLAEFGGVYEERDVGAYVASIGGRLAAHSEMPDLAFTFTVLNSPMVNAFALPGGYVYITRGLLALANSEAELAGVLGHEIGHVTARHTAQRYSRATWAGLGGVILGAVTKSDTVARLAQQGSQLYLLSFSRDQEYQADSLGIRYLSRAGYDPLAEADFLASLDAEGKLAARLAGQEGRERGSDFLSTHPLTSERVTRARTLAANASSASNRPPRQRDAFMDVVDGIIYGDDPKQGLVRGRTFAHPIMRLEFTVPEGFQIINTDAAVAARDRNGNIVIFDGDKDTGSRSMTEYLQRQAGQSLSLQGVQSISINGMPAATAWTSVSTQQGTRDVRFVVIRFDRERIYRFQIVTPQSQSSAMSEPMRRMTYSFRRLTESEAAALKPLRLRVITVAKGDSVASLSQKMAFDDFKAERFSVLNGLAPGEALSTGQRVKIVTEE